MSTLSPPPDPTTAEVAGLLARHLRPAVVQIDREGAYAGELLRQLGAAGAFVGPGRSHDLGPALRHATAVSRWCGTTGFAAWCQNASAWYLANTGNDHLRTRYLDDVASARRLAGTALSNPMKFYAQLEPLKLSGTRAPGGYVVNGALPWVSNLGPDHAFAILFATPTGTAAAYLTCDQPGLRLTRTPPFAAMEGSATFALRFDHVFVPDADLLAEPAEPFIRKVQAGFLLLQLGLGFGIVHGALHDLSVSDDSAPDEIGEALAALEQQAAPLAANPLDPSPEFLRAVLRLRLAAAELALRATQTAALHAGALGLLANAAPQRRLREALFFGIVTPSIRHLQRLLATV